MWHSSGDIGAGENTDGGVWPERTLSSSLLQVINKYGDLYGAERIAELLGLDKNALDFSPVEETKAEAASLVSWYRA